MVPGNKHGGVYGSSFGSSGGMDKLNDLPSPDTELDLLEGVEAIKKGLLSASLKEMLDYYVSLRPGAGGMPPRSAFNPAELPRHLPNIFLVELEKMPDGHVDYRYRVFGTALAVLFGAEMTGKLVSEYPGPNRAKRSRRILDHVVSLARPVRSAGHFTSKNGMPVFGESLIMPFGEAGAVTHVLADLDYDAVD